MNAFDEKQLKIFLYDDLLKDSKHFMEEVFSFVGVDPKVKVELTERSNASKGAPNALLRYLFNRDNYIRRLSRAIFSERTRAKYKAYLLPSISDDQKRRDEEFVLTLRPKLRDEIHRLQHLTGRDLNHWL